MRPVVVDLDRHRGALDESQCTGVDEFAEHRGVAETQCEAARRAVQQHPGAADRAFHPVELPVRLGGDHHVAALRALRAGGVGGRAEVQGRAAVGEVASVPGTAGEADVDLSDFLDLDLQAPGLEEPGHPLLGVLEGVRTHDAPADAVGEEVLVLHRTVVRRACLNDFLHHFVRRGGTEDAQG